MAMSKKKKSAVAVATAAALLLSGTFAWQGISQTALNEASDVINPGGRLHDDFNGTNKDVYVENFADDDIFARVRLDEYFEIVMNQGTAAENRHVVVGDYDEGTGEKTGKTYVFGQSEETKDYWQWTTGGSKIFMPTFNKNKDSLAADINGTYAQDYQDYVEYADGETLDGTEIYDADSNQADEIADGSAVLDENYKEVTATHTAKSTGNATLISMDEWLALGEEEQVGEYWVYDTDGWVYWAKPIAAGEATGLLLDEIGLKQVMDDSWYYFIDVTAQFITADDLGQEDNTGFFADGETVSDNALALLKKIGVDVKDSAAATTLTYSVVEPADWDGSIAKGQSVTLKVDGEYTADDLEWGHADEMNGTGCVTGITENDDGSVTLTGGLCGGSGDTIRVSLTSDPSVYLDIDIACGN